MILAVTKIAAAEKDREEDFSSKSKKVKDATVSAVETSQVQNSVVGKLANLLEKFDKRVASMESRFDTLDLKQNQRTTRLLCKGCNQNNLSGCWHCFKNWCEGHAARFCSEKNRN